MANDIIELYQIDIENTEWTPEEVKIGEAILKKINFLRNTRPYRRALILPGFLASLLAQTTLSVWGHVAFMNNKEQIYLIDGPDEEASGRSVHEKRTPAIKWEKYDDFETTIRDLEEKEFFGGSRDNTSAQVGINYFIALQKYDDPWRGDCLVLVSIVIFNAEPTLPNSNGRWYKIKEIPFEDVSSVDRAVILPHVLSKWTEWKHRAHE
ncbi:MAG: hypothetical protein AAB604_01925 [Patescibacteria group bacterium]